MCELLCRDKEAASHSKGGIPNGVAKDIAMRNYLIVVNKEWKLFLGEKSGLSNIHAIFSIEKLNH